LALLGVGLLLGADSPTTTQKWVRGIGDLNSLSPSTGNSARWEYTQLITPLISAGLMDGARNRNQDDAACDFVADNHVWAPTLATLYSKLGGKAIAGMSTDRVNLLNLLGSNGWDLQTTVIEGDKVIYMFKRPIDTQKSP
jgi:hypothetical protein